MNHTNQILDKLYTTQELMDQGICTTEYRPMDEPCTVIGILVLKAECDRRTMRMFFRLEDGRRVFTPVFWWQRYLSLPQTPIGTRLQLTYVRNSKGIHLGSAEVAEV